MRKQLLVLVSMFSLFRMNAERDIEYSKSFMFTRPGYAHLNIYDQLWLDIIFNKRGSVKAAVQAIPYVQSSFSSKAVTQYFLFYNKTELSVVGDAHVDEQHTRDIRAEWVNLPADFSGRLTVDPQQTQLGCVFFYNQNIDTFMNKLFDVSFFDGWQMTITLPFVHMKNDVNLEQFDIHNPVPNKTGPNDILQAFDQPSWCHGKIVDGAQKRNGFGEINVTFGSAYMCQNNYIIEYHTTFTLPACHKQRDRNIFEPVMGTNGHAGIGGGATFQLLLNNDTSKYLCCGFFGLDSQFLIHSKQRRTFDLVGKPWSRFLLFNKRYGPPNQNIPGVNILTRDALIRPMGRFDFTTGLRIKRCAYTFEIGYNMWGHDREVVQELYPLDETDPIAEYGIASVQNPADLMATTASQSTIQYLAAEDTNADGDPTFIAITDFTIDYKSGGTGSAFNQKFHMSLGYTHSGEKTDKFAGLGYFIDLPIKNGALKTWGLWAKLGAAF